METKTIAPEKLVIGLMLIAVGIAAFLGAIDVLDVGHLWRLWPLVLIILGLTSEIEGIRQRRSTGGWILLAIGVWFAVGNWELFGLSHGSAIPIAIIVAGAALVVHALVDQPQTKTTKENQE